jgi:hypothetical protein
MGLKKQSPLPQLNDGCLDLDIDGGKRKKVNMLMVMNGRMLSPTVRTFSCHYGEALRTDFTSGKKMM